MKPLPIALIQELQKNHAYDLSGSLTEIKRGMLAIPIDNPNSHNYLVNGLYTFKHSYRPGIFTFSNPFVEADHGNNILRKSLLLIRPSIKAAELLFPFKPELEEMVELAKKYNLENVDYLVYKVYKTIDILSNKKDSLDNRIVNLYKYFSSDE